MEKAAMRSQIFWKNFFSFLADTLTETEKEVFFEMFQHKRLTFRKTIRPMK